MRLGIRLLLLTAVAVLSAPAADSAAQAEVERTRALVEAGALPRQALDKARNDAERERLETRVRQLTAKTDLTREEVPELSRSAQRLYEIARDELDQARKLVEAGAIPPNDLAPYKERLDSAQTRRDLIETRVGLVRQLQAMASAEERFEELEEEELAFAYEGDGDSGLWCEDLEIIMGLYFDEFGDYLPISADGDTELHRSMGFDHTGRVDVALHPDDYEGFFLIEVLESWGIPYIAFRSAVPGQATGPHIHIGLPSPPYAEPPAAPEEIGGGGAPAAAATSPG